MNTTTLNLDTLKLNVLVSMVNELGGNATAKTFSQRSKAVERINKLAVQKNVDLASYFEADGSKRAAPAVVEAPVVEVAPVVEAKAKKVSIRSVAESLLATVAATEDGKPVGLSYEDILAKVKGQFPSAKTTVGCLRWYAAALREQGVAVPNRPRAKAAQA